MTKRIRLTRGYADVFDARGYPAFAKVADRADTLPSGRVVPRYVFHNLTGNSADRELRGRPVEVTDAQAEELLTSPTLRTSGVAGLLFEEQTIERWELEQRRGRLTGYYAPIDGEADTPDLATTTVGEARTPEEVRGDVKRELAGTGDGAIAEETPPPPSPVTTEPRGDAAAESVSAPPAKRQGARS